VPVLGLEDVADDGCEQRCEPRLQLRSPEHVRDGVDDKREQLARAHAGLRIVPRHRLGAPQLLLELLDLARRLRRVQFSAVRRNLCTQLQPARNVRPRCVATWVGGKMLSKNTKKKPQNPTT
jgi:hypothetical protein